MNNILINKTNLMLGISLILLQVYDIYITVLAISLGGINVESNPIVKFFIKNYGVLEGLIFIKLLAICLIVGLVLYNKKINYIRKLLIVTLTFYIVLLGYMTICNYDILF